MKRLPSPNFNSRTEGAKVAYIVLHYTGMPTAQEAIARLCDPAAEVSAHYVIDEDGTITQLVEDPFRAWHAGQSFWRGETDLNSLSIGIELVNPGHEFGYRPFPTPQILALKKLLHELMRQYELPSSAIIGHSDIAPERKQDPGELFPWRELAFEGLGIWPKPVTEDYAPATPEEIRDLLRRIGYDCPDNNPTKAAAAAKAFQRHYCPDTMSNDIGERALPLLRAMARIS